MASISASDRAALMKLNEDARKAKAKFAETDAKLAYRTNFRQRNLLTKVRKRRGGARARARGERRQGGRD